MNGRLSLELVNGCVQKNQKKITEVHLLPASTAINAELKHLYTERVGLFLRQADIYLTLAFHALNHPGSETPEHLCQSGLVSLTTAEIQMREVLPSDEAWLDLHYSKAKLHSLLGYAFGEATQTSLSQNAFKAALEHSMSEVSHLIESFQELHAIMDKAYSQEVLVDMRHCAIDVNQAASRLNTIVQRHAFFRAPVYVNQQTQTENQESVCAPKVRPTC